jgi:acetate kinase
VLVAGLAPHAGGAPPSEEFDFMRFEHHDDNSTVTVLVIPTNEELAIARDCVRLV